MFDLSAESLCDVVAADPELTAVSKRRDQLTVPIKQPPGVDRGQMRRSTVAVEPNRVALGRLLGGGCLVIDRSREVKDITRRLVASYEPVSSRSSAAM